MCVMGYFEKLINMKMEIDLCFVAGIARERKREREIERGPIAWLNLFRFII